MTMLVVSEETVMEAVLDNEWHNRVDLSARLDKNLVLKDPQSKQPIELGTLEFPYRSFKSVNFEITKFFSHSNASIIIYTKDAYIEDGTNRYLNLTSVTIVAHPAYEYLIYQPILIPTAVPQSFISEKALLHLINKVDASLEDSITTAFQNGDFDNYEESLFGASKITILPIRTSLIIKNIDIYREEVEPDSLLKFIIVGNLQTKVIHIENVSLNITGSFIYNQRPANIWFENIKIDLVKFHAFYDSDFLQCNYPEAHLTPTLFAKNFSMVNTNIHNGRAPTDIIRTSDVGNITITEINCRNHFTYIDNLNNCVSAWMRPLCLPDDDRMQIVDYSNFEMDYTSPNPDYVVANSLAANTQHYRRIHFSLDNLYCENARMNHPYLIFGMLGTFLDTTIMKNLVFKNSTNSGHVLISMAVLSQEVYNVTFIDTDEAIGHSLACPIIINVVMRDIKYINYRVSATSGVVSILIQPISLTTSLVFDNFYFENSTFRPYPLMFIPDAAAMVQVTNNYFKNTQLGGSNIFFRLAESTNFVFQNNTLVL